jgi:predicted aminopeptidase
MRGLTILCLLLTQLSGCALGYYAQAVGGQADLLRRRVPIERLLEQLEVDSTLARSLRRVTQLRAFAVTELGLPDNSSYRSYVALDRPSVVWNVVATEEFSVDPRRWCYPLVGCVTYRGYFRQSSAEDYAERLAEKGFDVYVGGSTAYSTLGFFADPVLSTMLAGGEQALAETLFHELAHQRIYIKGDTALSEAFATTVAEFGTETWLEQDSGRNAAAEYRRRLCYREDFGDMILRQQDRLRALFAQPLPEAGMRAAKAAAFAQLQSDYAQVKARWGGYTGYDAWAAQLTNNAELAAFATYRRWVPTLRQRLDELGMEAFYRTVEELSEIAAEQREAQLEEWRSLDSQRPACWRNTDS